MVAAIVRRICHAIGPVLAVIVSGGLCSCDSPRGQALRELSNNSIEPSGQRLVRAVKERDFKTTALLLESGVYTEQRDPLGLTPLAIAALHGDFEAIVMLLNAGANVNATLPRQTSILGTAIAQGDPLIIGTLISSGARIDGLMPDGEKILPWAIRNGHLRLVRTMMKSGSDPHLRDSRGNPLLHVAMDAGRRDLVESLVDLGADPAAVNASGETTLVLALRQGWADMLPKLAAAGADPNAPDQNGFTPLQNAVREKDTDRMVLFLKIGADPFLCLSESGNRSPFQAAFEAGRGDWLDLMLHAHPGSPAGGWESWLWRSFEKRDLEMARRLMPRMLASGTLKPGPQWVERAVEAGHAGFLKLFLDYGFPTGNALTLCCVRDDHRMAGLLLAYGVSPDFTWFPTRQTPLGLALRNGSDQLAVTLIEHGADPQSILPDGQRALHLAIAKSCPLAVEAILAKGSSPDEPFITPVSPDFLKLVRPGAMRWVLKMDRGATPLMLAADTGNVATARSLIRAGARTGVRTRISSLWPINFASRRSDVPMMRLFLGQDPHREERRIEVSLSEQRARMFDAEGREIFNTKVSTGRRGFTTPTGEYVITNKHRDWTSTLYHASMPYFQRLSCGDFGLHQGVVPGYPASHGCIRVPAGIAAKLFSMTKTGDRVRILP